MKWEFIALHLGNLLLGFIEKMNQKKLTKGIEELNNEATRSEKENAVEDEGNEDEDEADMADNDDQDCKESESTVTSAMKIHKTIQTTILPQLHKSLVKKVLTDFSFMFIDLRNSSLVAVH